MEAQILNKARDLFFSYGLKSVSMDDLAKEAGVSKKTVYQVVADKNELVMRVAQQLVQCHDEGLAQCRRQAANAVEEVVLQAKMPFTALAAINHSFFYDLEKFFPEAWQLLMRHRNDHLLPHIIANLGRGIAEGLYREDIDMELTPQIRLQQLQSALQPGSFTSLMSNLPELINRLTRFYLHSIANAKGRKLINTYFNNTNNTKLER